MLLTYLMLPMTTRYPPGQGPVRSYRQAQLDRQARASKAQARRTRIPNRRHAGQNGPVPRTPLQTSLTDPGHSHARIPAQPTVSNALRVGVIPGMQASLRPSWRGVRVLAGGTGAAPAVPGYEEKCHAPGRVDGLVGGRGPALTGADYG